MYDASEAMRIQYNRYIQWLVADTVNTHILKWCATCTESRASKWNSHSNYNTK